MAMNVLKRAESSTPAWPKHSFWIELGRLQRNVAHGVQWIGDDDDDGIRRILGRLLSDAAHDVHVDAQQVVAAHSRLARRSRCDDYDIRTRRCRIIVGASYGHVVANDWASFGKVECLALRQVLDDVDQDNVGNISLGQILGGRCADHAGPDHRDFRAHLVSTSRSRFERPCNFLNRYHACKFVLGQPILRNHARPIGRYASGFESVLHHSTGSLLVLTKPEKSTQITIRHEPKRSTRDRSRLSRFDANSRLFDRRALCYTARRLRTIKPG